MLMRMSTREGREAKRAVTEETDVMSLVKGVNFVAEWVLRRALAVVSRRERVRPTRIMWDAEARAKELARTAPRPLGGEVSTVWGMGWWFLVCCVRTRWGR